MQIELTYTDISAFPPDEGEWGRLTAVLPAYFKEKVEEIGNEELRRQRLAAGLLLTYILKGRGLGAGDIKITEGPNGKPDIEEPAGLYFNLSHSDTFVLLAVSDAEVGCDIQRVKNGRNIPARFFTAEENEALNKADEGQRDKLFTRLWARKESYIKATGEGLKHDLRSFSVLEGMTPDGYVFADHDLGNYIAAVCIHTVDRVFGMPDDIADISFLPFQNIVNVIL